jgi:3-hydroxyisobutyrate dehydrogenase
VGTERSTFDKAFPVIRAMGRQILHTGPLGSASILKVVTNYLASVNLVAIGEAMMTAHCAGVDLSTTYEAIRISSGNSFVHETEGQVILNGSRDINFTLDLVVKDMTLFQAVADRGRVPLEMSPLVLEIFKDGEKKYGPREWSPNIVRRLEEACGHQLLAAGFPSEIVDHEGEEAGEEIVPISKF